MRIIDPTYDPRWAELINEKRSDVFHSPGWMRVLEKTYGFAPRAAVVEDDGALVAGVPFVELDDVRGRRTIVLPFSDTCDPIVDDAAQWDAIFGQLAALGAPIRMRVLHDSISVNDDRFEHIGRAKWHAIDLGSSIDDLWNSIDAGARRAVRKARKEGVVVRPARGRDELRAFFDLHLGTRKYKYRLLSQPYAFFENIWNEFVENDSGMLMLASHDDMIIGGIFFLEWNGVLHYKFNASGAGTISLRPNDLALWTAIEAGVERGMSAIDFGLSDWDQEGLVRYKRKYASREETITALRFDPSPMGLEGGSEVGGLLGQMTDLLTSDAVPDATTEQAGELLYRYFA